MCNEQPSVSALARDHALLYIDRLASQDVFEIWSVIERLYRPHSILTDYADTFIETLRHHDHREGATAHPRFQEHLEQSVSSQQYEMAKLPVAFFDAQDMEGMACQDADAYLAGAGDHNEASLLLWQRIAVGMRHQTYRHTLVAQLVRSGIPAQRFTRDMSAYQLPGEAAKADTGSTSDGESPLHCLALRHARLYLDPSLCEREGYDQPRLLGEIFALKPDELYWQSLEAHVLASDPVHGAIHLYWFRQEVAFFEAHRKTPLFNEDDLFAFGTLNPALLTEPDAHVLQGGMSGALRTAHGHSERGAYAHQELKKGSFADAIKDL